MCVCDYVCVCACACACACVCVCVCVYCEQREGKYPPVLIISYDTFRLHAERLAVNGLRHLCLRLCGGPQQA